MDDGSRSPGPGRKRMDSAVSGAEFAGIGVQFALAILVFVYAGVWLDKRLGSTPWLTLIGVFVGAAGGFYSMYRKITASQRREVEQQAKRRSGPPA